MSSEEQYGGSFREDFARLAESHERSTETLAEGLREIGGRLESYQRDTNDKFERLIKESNQRFSNLYERLERDRKTPWAPVGIAATIVLAIGGVFGNNYTADQNELKGDVKLLEATVVERIKEAEYRRGQLDAFVDAQQAAHTQLIDWNRRLMDEIRTVEEREIESRTRLDILMKK
jgi:ElaB/YqjD/DUF883 family membrane-anchored ribosome-binding protein